MKPRNLTCPACGNTLTEEDVCGLKVDICKNGCAGIWFDRNELERVDEKCERYGLALLNIPKNPEVKVNPSKVRICPTCERVKMRKHYWSVKKEVELDECDKCGGIWLDEGELEKIRSSFKNEEEKNAAAEAYFKQFSHELLNRVEKENRKKAAWYDKLAFAIFGM